MDLRLFEDINKLAAHSGAVDWIMKAIAQFGPYVFVAVFILLWFWPARRSSRDSRQRGAVLAAASALIALGINQIIIHLWARPRPFVFHPAILLLPASHDPSFPSDHATFVFAAAVALLLISRRLGLPALLFAAVVAFSRVYTGEHYPADVAAGALIGSVVALLVCSQASRLSPVIDPALRLLRRLHLA